MNYLYWESGGRIYVYCLAYLFVWLGANVLEQYIKLELSLIYFLLMDYFYFA
jgi:hypothetical protein